MTLWERILMAKDKAVLHANAGRIAMEAHARIKSLEDDLESLREDVRKLKLPHKKPGWSKDTKPKP